MEGNQLFPVFIKLNTIHTVLVGAGPIGLEKLSALLDNSQEARVTVIGIDVLPELQALADGHERVNVLQKSFEPADLNGADLVIAATNNELLNQEIRIQASQRNLLVNFADKPELCDFYLGSVVKKGDLKIAISTNGKSPTIAKRLKEVLSDGLPAELNDTLQNMQALRSTLNGDFAAKVKKLNEVTSVLVEGKVAEEEVIPADGKPKTGKMKWLIWLAIVFAFAIVVATFWHKEPEFQAYAANINPMFYWFLLGGFIFAMIDGAIGMSYGVTTTSFSLALGVPPASASMGVHLSEILSNGIAGWMHYRFGNVNWKLFKLLLVPGIIGAVTGAYLLSSLEHYSHYTKPIVSLYTLILGFVILSKAYQANRKGAAKKSKIKKIGLLGLFGGFVDAVGGGGWGSIVLSSLIAGGRNARFSLGTVKITRFFIALMSSLTFITMLNGAHWEAVGGLVIGSALASPIAARVSNKISAKTIMIAVGILVVLVSLRSIIKFILELV